MIRQTPFNTALPCREVDKVAFIRPTSCDQWVKPHFEEVDKHLEELKKQVPDASKRDDLREHWAIIKNTPMDRIKQVCG